MRSRFVIGAPPPADPTGSTSAVAKTYPAVLEKAASVVRWPAEAIHEDKEVEAARKKTLEGAGYKVLKTGLVTPAWEIDKNEMGVPVRRKRLGVIMVQTKGEAFCRNYVLIPGSDATGINKYGSTVVSFDPQQLESTITKCN